MALIITGPLAITGGLCAAVGYVANSVTFDGLNDFLLLSSAIGGADSSATLVSIWFKTDDAAGDASLMLITDTTDEHFRVSRNALDQIEINLENDASTVLWNFTSTNTFNSTTNTGWHHLIFSADLGGSPTATVYLDNAVLAGTDNTVPTTGSIDFTPAAWSFAADVSGANKLTGSLSEVYIHTVSLDLAIEANRRKFINSAGKAVFLGTDGSIPTDTVPLIFLTGATAVWEVNKGSGNGFTLTGSIETGTTPDVPAEEGGSPVSFTEGSMFTWGNEFLNGLMGQGTTNTPFSSPSIIGALTDWTKISAGADHSMAIRANGDMWGWGSDTEGQLGNDSEIGNRYSTLQQVTTPGVWSDVVAGGLHTLAIKTDGTLWAWGSNDSSEVGNASGFDERSPISIGGGTWIRVAAGVRHSAAIKSGGSLYTWGFGGYGQLGHGNTLAKNIPTLMAGGGIWNDVSCGNFRTVAIKTDGTLWSWGKDDFMGALGLGTTNTNKSSPSQVGSDSDWSRVYTNLYHSTMVLKTNGELWGFGYNSFASAGMLGVGDTAYHTTPARVGNDTNWAKVDIGAGHGLGIRTDGTLWAWGSRDGGTLGDGLTTPNVSAPIQIGLDENWAQVSGGAGIHFESRSLGIRDTYA